MRRAVAFAASIALALLACSGDDAPSTNTSSSSSSSAATGGSGGASPCSAICAVAKACAATPASDCDASCATLRAAPCSTKLDAIEACFAQNLGELSSCGHSHTCEPEVSAYQSCISMNEPTGASATSSGSGGADGICDQPACLDSTNGICSCTRDCGGASDGFSCIAVPGGLMCSCAIAGVPPFGDCFQKDDGCMGDFATSCCEAH